MGMRRRKVPVLETRRLILRPVRLDDAVAIQKHFKDWEIIKNLSVQVPWPYPEDGALSFIRDSALPRMEREEACVWAVTMKGEAVDEAVGLIDFRFEDNGMGNRGFWIARSYQGKGLMTEAVVAVNDFVFFECGLERILVANAAGNAGSRRVKEKTGAVFLKSVEIEHNGGEKNAELWMVSAENWRKLKERNDENLNGMSASS